LENILQRFLTRLITGFDDTLTQVPVISYLTKTRMGKIAFALGMVLAVILAVIISIFFSSLITNIPYYKHIVVMVLFILAGIIYFDVLRVKRVQKTKTKIKKVQKIKRISRKRFIKLVIAGFVAALATVLDDIIVYSSLLLQTIGRIGAIAGIFSAAILEAGVIVYFSRKLSKLRYRKEIASLGLIILGLLILFEVL